MKRFVVSAAALGFALWLISALLNLPATPLDLRPLLAEAMPKSGVAHPVTAVLLNTRGYDTLLEIAVLLVALIGVLVAVPSTKPALSEPPAAARDAMVPALARLIAPLAVFFAIYVLWAGAHRPGGAFQAAAILAAGLVLLHLGGLTAAWSSPALRLRVGLIAGFLIFLAIAALPLFGGMLLQYPPAFAGTLILVIESGLTISLALVLAGLFLLLAERGGKR
jgi:multisubunit Na+/H+ antiporter MnhB subunit